MNGDNNTWVVFRVESILQYVAAG